MKSKMIKALFVFGTRPEAIKMAPVIREMEADNSLFKVVVCVTAQHREMLDQVLKLFSINPHYDLDIMTERQSLPELTASVLLGVTGVMEKEHPDLIFVQGDTTTTFAAALAAYYLKIPIGHVEAGLRTGNIYSPWPEEVNRCLVGQIAKIHFAPTESSKQNLLRENKSKEDIVVTGNTVIDALFWMLDRIKTDKGLREKITVSLRNLFSGSSFNLDKVKLSQRRMVLITGHRRENFGSGFLNICKALKNLAIENKTVDFVYPVHLNPSVQKPVYNLLSKINNIHPIEPLSYETFIYLMDLSSIILTDSGGVQEEAPSLGKPVLLMRDTTERPEAVDAGTVKLVGTDDRKIFDETMNLLHNQQEYQKMAKAHNPYGDGKASKRIVEVISEHFRKNIRQD